MNTFRSARALHVLPLFVILATVLTVPAAAAGGEEATKEFFERREASLRRPDGWLSLVGLHALIQGQPTIGSAGDLKVPARHPAVVGHFVLDAEPLRFVAHPDVEARVGDATITEVAMQPDTSGDPTLVEVGSLLFYVIERNNRAYLRVKDREAELLSSFEGVPRWDYDPALHVQARFVPHEEHDLFVADVLGGGEATTCNGAVEFTIDGRIHRLEPTWKGDERWSFIYGDASNGIDSYGAGRFLYFDAPGDDGRIDLDFNQSYNPPCVFTAYSTCPLPPDANVLPIAIHAGEKMWEGHGE